MQTIDVAPRLTLCISKDGDLARRSLKRYVAHYAAIIRPADLLEREGGAWMARVEAALERSSGWYFDHDRVDDPELDVLVDDDLVRRFAIAGTPDECAELTRRGPRTRLHERQHEPRGTRRGSLYEGLRETLEGSAELLGILRG